MIISAGSEDEFGVGLAPIHGIDAFRMYSIDDHNGTFLISEVPNL